MKAMTYWVPRLPYIEGALLSLCVCLGTPSFGEDWPSSSDAQSEPWPKSRDERVDWPQSAREAEFESSPASSFLSISHKVPLYRQDTIVWCWVASAKMVSEFYSHSTPTQCEMLQQVYNSPCCSMPGVCHRAGYIAEIANLIRLYGGQTTDLKIKRDPIALYQALKSGPVIVHTNQGAGHFIVLTGFRVSKTNSGLDGYVSINDPFIGKYELELADFWPMWDAALSVQ